VKSNRWCINAPAACFLCTDGALKKTLLVKW